MRKLFILILVLLPISAFAFDQTTLQMLEQDVKNNIALAADPYYPDSVLDDFINLACRDVASRGAIIRTDTVTMTANQWIISLPKATLEVEAVFPCTTYGSRGYDRISFRDWGKIAASNQLTTAKYYAFLPAYYDMSDSDHSVPQLYMYPANAVAKETTVVIYYEESNILLVDADTTNIPYMYRQLVVFYATALAYSYVQEYDKATWWFALYDQWCVRYGLLPKKPISDWIIIPREITK